jgi:hypothetical protein
MSDRVRIKDVVVDANEAKGRHKSSVEKRDRIIAALRQSTLRGQTLTNVVPDRDLISAQGPGLRCASKSAIE